MMVKTFIYVLPIFSIDLHVLTLIRLKMLTNFKESGLLEDREKVVYFALSLFRTLDIPFTRTFWHLFD